MKLATTIFLSFYFLLAGLVPNMDFHELAKLPTLVAHYLDCEEDSSESFFAFLQLHYSSDVQKDDGHHNDEHDGKLPFQEHHSCHISHVFIAVNSSSLFSCEVELTENVFANYQHIVSSEYLNSIFQPPKA